MKRNVHLCGYIRTGFRKIVEGEGSGKYMFVFMSSRIVVRQGKLVRVCDGVEKREERFWLFYCNRFPRTESQKLEFQVFRDMRYLLQEGPPAGEWEYFKMSHHIEYGTWLGHSIV